MEWSVGRNLEDYSQFPFLCQSRMSSLKSKISHLYRQYELNTAIYMLEPAEKVAMHTFFLTILGLVTYSSYVYLPHYTKTMLAFFGVLDMEE